MQRPPSGLDGPALGRGLGGGGVTTGKPPPDPQPASHLDTLDASFDAQLLHQLPGLGYIVTGGHVEPSAWGPWRAEELQGTRKGMNSWPGSPISGAGPGRGCLFRGGLLGPSTPDRVWRGGTDVCSMASRWGFSSPRAPAWDQGQRAPQGIGKTKALAPRECVCRGETNGPTLPCPATCAPPTPFHARDTPRPRHTATHGPR